MSEPSATKILEAQECSSGGCACHASARKGHGLTHCPAHEDQTPSLSVNEGADGKVLFNCQAGCPQDRVLEELKARDLWPNGSGPKQDSPGRRIVAEYNYVDKKGWLICQTVRYRPKDFRQRRPDPDAAGSWIWEIHSIRAQLVLYRLSELLKAPERTVFICEGEKDADRLASMGLLATTNPLGAKKWYRQYTETLKGRSVVICEDNDPAGREHVAKMVRELLAAGCEVRVLRFPELPEKGDVSDWLDAGHTIEELKERVLSLDAEQPKTAGPYRLQVEDSDPPVWLQHWPRGVIRVANEDLFNWENTRRAFTATLKCDPEFGAGMSRGQFEEHVYRLLAKMDQDADAHVPVPEARTWRGRVRLLLVEMARSHRGRIDVDSERFFFKFATLVHHNAQDFNIQKGIDRERMTRVMLQAGVERLGGVTAKGSQDSWVPLRALELPEEPGP